MHQQQLFYKQFGTHNLKPVINAAKTGGKRREVVAATFHLQSEMCTLGYGLNFHAFTVHGIKFCFVVIFDLTMRTAS